MGSKFTPSLDNLFMALWEEQMLYTNSVSELQFWCRFIDDAFFLWRGDCDSINTFMAHLNSNTWGNNFTYEWSETAISFLDLLIYREGNQLLTKTHLKNTDGNGFIPHYSRH